MIGTGLGPVAAAARGRASAPPAGGGGSGAPAAPAARFAAFPRLAAAYAGGRALVTVIGDSTTFGLGAGDGGFYGTTDGAAALSPPAVLIDRLRARGIAAVGGAACFATRNAYQEARGLAAYYGGAVEAGAGFFVSGSWPDVSAWGRFFADNGDASALSFDPGFAWDRAEVFVAAPVGISDATFAIEAGGAVIDQGTYGSAPPYGGVQKRAVARPRGTGPIAIRRRAGYLGVGGVRCWDSAGPCVQVENLGNPSWQASDWVEASRAYSPLGVVALLGSHLCIVNLGLNDAHYGRTAAAFAADLRTLARAILAAGADVLLAIPHVAGPSYALPADMVAAIGAVAGDLGLAAPVDLRAIGLVDEDYYDDVHLRAAGYAKVGAAYAARLLG